MSNKIVSAILGSLTNLVNGDTPNFQRSSPTWLEYIVSGGIRLEPVEAYQPGIDRNDGAIILEPECVNLVNYNTDLGQNIWLKGSNCNVAVDKVLSPDALTEQADRITWSSGQGLSQSLKRIIYLAAGKTYTLSMYLLLPNGEQARETDVLRFNTGVLGNPRINLTQLNAGINRYQIIQKTFITNGQQITLPSYSHANGYIVTAVGSSTVVLNIATPISQNQFVGGRISFGTSSDMYNILANTAGNGAITLTLDGNNISTSGIRVNTKAYFHSAPDVAVEIELYVESTLTLNFGGIQIEQRDFRTSIVYQSAGLNVRAASKLEYRRNLIGNLKSLGVFLDIREWRGDGNIFNAGNLKATIIGGKLVVTTGAVVLNLPKLLPRSARIYIQISNENNNISVYVNGILEARTSIYNFVGDQKSLFVLTSEGYRAFLQILVFDQILLDGQVEIGQSAKGEISQLFSNQITLDAAIISANTPPIVLPVVTIPPRIPPIASSLITGVNVANQTITVLSNNGFAANQAISIIRDDKVIINTKILVITGNIIQLETIYGIVIGDQIAYGNIDQPGLASVRFPYTPIDKLPILEVNTSNTPHKIRVLSSLNFSKQRAIITSVSYQDIAEVTIINKDDNNGWLFIEDATGILAGHIISQPKNELIVEPDCYEAYLLKEFPGVSINAKFTNGIQLLNRNSFPVEVQPAIRVSSY